MELVETKKRSLLSIERIAVGVESSRLSSIIFALVCLVPAFAAVVFGAADNATWIVISILLAVTALVWLADASNGGGFLIETSSLQLPLFGLLCLGLIQLLPINGLTSLDPYSTRFFVVRLIGFIVFFAACLTYINTERRLKKVVLMLIVFGALIAFFGLIQRLANPDGIYGLRETPQAIPFGPFVNQHHFAALMQMTGGLAFGFLFGRDTSRDKRLMLVIAVLIMAVAVVLTGSRGGLLGFVSVIAFAGIVSALASRRAGSRGIDRRGKLVIAGAAAAVLIAVFAIVLFVGGNESLFRGVGLENADSDVSSGRFRFWPIALKIFLDHPIFGAGFDAFGVAYTKYDTANGIFRVEQAHNDYLQTLADAGLVGFVCITGFIVLLFRKGFRTIANAADNYRRNAAIGALAGCMGVLIHSFFDFPLRTPSNTFFFLLLASIATVSIGARRSDSSNLPPVTLL